MKNKIKQNIAICILLTLLGLWGMESNAQSSTAANLFNAAYYLGWTTANDLPFKMNGTQLMTLKHTSGDLNLNLGTSAYQIGANKILWHNNNTSDIFVGVSAGNATMTGHSNTLLTRQVFHLHRANKILL